ncbi:MAG: hypothetical protein ACJA01_004240 [Saprospiraceae bacterium]
MEESMVESSSKPKKEIAVSKPKPIKKKAIIVFDSLVYHLPDMTERGRVSIELRFMNEGEAPLSIKEVDVVCSCTTEVPFLDILPSKEGKIGIQYN